MYLISHYMLALGTGHNIANKKGTDHDDNIYTWPL